MADMTDDEMLQVANEIAKPHGLKAEFLPGFRRVGVGGDARKYTPVVVLIGPPPLQEILAEISTEISNRTGIMGVTYDITKLKECLPRSKQAAS